MYLILLVILICALVGAFHTGGYGWGYPAHSLITLLVVILIVLLLTGRL